MAGLYGDFAGERRFVILTTEANPSMEDVHSRMPVILPSGGLLEWINDAGAALERLRLWREMSQEELARDAECPVRTIRRLENGETKRPQLETVVRLCVALSLRWRLGEALLVRCGWVLRAGVYEDEVLRYVLEHCTDMALAEVRALLQGWGIYLL